MAITPGNRGTVAFRHSGIHASMHVHCLGPCRKSVLHVHVHAACPCSCPCCIPCQCCILCQCFMSMSMSMCTYTYVEMPECRTVRHPVSLVPDWKKLTMPEQVRYRTKIWDAGMPMPALVSSMPDAQLCVWGLMATLILRIWDLLVAVMAWWLSFRLWTWNYVIYTTWPFCIILLCIQPFSFGPEALNCK
jgi:hypothetical protein